MACPSKINCAKTIIYNNTANISVTTYCRWYKPHDNHPNNPAPDGANQQWRNEQSTGYVKAVGPGGQQMVKDDQGK